MKPGKIVHFLATQGLVQAVNVVSGLLALRILSLPEFATYMLIATLLSVGAFCADMGLSQAINSVGAKALHDGQQLGTVLASAKSIRRTLFGPSILVTAVLAFVMFTNIVQSRVVAVVGFVMVCIGAWAHQTLAMCISILNVHHDSNALFRSGMSAAITRLALIVLLLPSFPIALVAFGANLVGTLVAMAVANPLVSVRLGAARERAQDQVDKIWRFILPLFPGAIYFLVQGQVAMVFLSIGGHVANIAEVGALSRLGQILAFIAMLNPFWIQPTFARIYSRTEFGRRAATLVLALTGLAALLVLTTLLWPGVWLLILGHKYSSLAQELPIAVGFALISTIGATLFTLVMAIGDTRKQYLQIPVGIGAQCFFVVAFGGVNSTIEAVIVAGIPQLSYTLLQAILLVVYLTSSSPQALPPNRSERE